MTKPGAKGSMKPKPTTATVYTAGKKTVVPLADLKAAKAKDPVSA